MHNLICTTHEDDLQWSGEVSVKKIAGSTLKDYIFKQQIINLSSFLPLNLIGRAQERIQMAHAINLVLRDMSVHQILSIQVDALYISVPRGKLREIQKNF